MATTFTVEIDWDHDGTWISETTRTRRAQIRSGFSAGGAAADDSIAEIGRCTLTMNNSDERFSPGNTSGALYEKLLPRREVRVIAGDGVSTWTLFRGFIERIMPDAGEYGSGECVIECVDALVILSQQRVSVAHEDSKDVAEAVSEVVTLAYTPPLDHYGDNGDSLAHFGRGWLPEDITAAEALRQICGAVYGRFFIGRDGRATFLTRDERLDTSPNPVLTVGVSGLYWHAVYDANPANLLGLWRLSESEGYSAIDSSENALTGSYLGPTLAGIVGPDNENAPVFDGVNDMVWLADSGLPAVFNGAELTLMIWLKVTDGDVWTDSLARNVVLIAADSDNLIQMGRTATDGEFQVVYRAGGVSRSVTLTGLSTTAWVHLALVVSAAADSMKVFWNGVQQGSTLEGLGVWAGEPTAEFSLGGSGYSAMVWDGALALCALWDLALGDSVIAELAEV